MTTTVPESTQTDDNTVTLTIDGKEITAEKGELLITAAQRAGVFIPRFCYHDRLKPVGMCRMCLVEIEGVRGLPPACTTPVADGMNVSFQKDNVEKAQDGVLEFLLINHPLDCPVCDRGGECPLQDQTLSFGPGESRFVEEKRHWEKPIEISDHVLLDRERCIQCSRCTRFADDVAGDPLITFVERGGKTEVNTFPGDDFASYFSGNIVQICPVGALTAKPYRFNSRPWDLEGTETTCQGCSVGCKGEAQTSRNEMVRFLGVDSEPINQGWLCDKGRYGFDFAQSSERIRTPYISRDGEDVNVNFSEAIDSASSAIKNALESHGPDSIAFIGGARSTNEDAYALAKLAKNVIGTALVDSRVNNTLSPDFVLSANRARIADIDNAKAVIVIGSDIKESLPVVYLRVRKAVTENNVALINVNAAHTSTRSLAAKHIDLVPGNEAAALSDITLALGDIQRDGKIVVIAGDISPAQNATSCEALVRDVLATPDSVLLPNVAQSNALGAYEMGLAPGLLAGRVASGVNALNSDTESILDKAIAGDVKVLVLSGANLVDHARDKNKAIKALENVDTIIALDCFKNASTQHADIFIPVSVANEKDGTVTNIEGRVQRVVRVVSPQGVIMDEWKVAALIADQLDAPQTWDDVNDVTNEIARVATSFAHLTTGVLLRARDGAIVPVDENQDVLVHGAAPGVDTPSWEPIASRAYSDEDPRVELIREEHHPSANVAFSEMITAPLSELDVHNRHLDQYALRLVFVDSFHRASPMTLNSSALSFVAKTHVSHTVRVHPKDLESIAVREDNLVKVSNDIGSVQLRVIPDKSVLRGTMVAQMQADHPLRDIIAATDVVDVTIEAGV
jgi:NADH-quinone oxidoreductase subunit G